MTMNLQAEDDWVPEACSLPTVEQPLRRREFDDLFHDDVIGVVPESPQQVRLDLRAEPAAVGRAASLAAKETGCCSFFTFELKIADGNVSMTVSAAPAHAPVLAALAARAEAQLGGRA
jgi:hypothetical protein